MAMNPVQLRRFAQTARDEAKDYREQAATASPYWRERFLTSAAVREDDADFYERKARELQ
jgi:hypothetical protein